MSSPAPGTTAAPTVAASTTETKPTRIRAAMGFGGLDNLALANTGGIVFKGLSTTAYLTNPPIPAADLGNILTSFNTAIQALPNGGPAAEAEVDKYRKQLIQALKMDALYSQNNCNDDLTIFLSSGYSVLVRSKTPAGPVAIPEIRALGYGAKSGELTVALKKTDGARFYYVRYAPLVNGVPGTWVTATIVKVNTKLKISNLTPGTVYTFEAQAVGNGDSSDWSDPSTIMCV